MKTIKQGITILLCLISSLTFAQTSKVHGNVTDTQGTPLPFAAIYAVEANQGTQSDGNGKYYINLSEGMQILRISYLGYQVKEVSIEVKGSMEAINFMLEENKTELGEVVAYGELTRGQAKALNIQKLAPNIKNVVDAEMFSQFPDVSAAETVQRLPGISITRDQGEGEYVQIRGVSEQYNSLTLNGQKMPTVEEGVGRTVGLDLIQSYLIQSIEVSKAITPDMEADAIGGMVNFQLKEASKQSELSISAGYGINAQESEYQNWGKDVVSFSAIGAKRFADNKVGVLLAGSYHNTDRGSMFNSQRFNDLENDDIYRRRSTDYDINRKRTGLVANIDYVPNANNKWVLTSNYNNYVDDEIRQQARYTWDNNKEERRVRNRTEDQAVFFNMLKGEHRINKMKLDYVGSYSIGKEDIPDRTEWRYSRTVEALSELDRKGQANLSANSTFGDTDPFVFTKVDYKPEYAEEENISAGFDLSIPIMENDKSVFKLGGKYRQLNREYLNGSFTPKGGTVPDFQEGGFPMVDVRFTDDDFAQYGFDLTPDDISDEDFSGYNASETVIAAYLMNTTQWTSKLSSVVGLRIENTTTDYSSKENKLEGNGTYTNFLPSVHLNYDLDAKSKLRAAYSTGLSRPNYSVLVPYEVVGDDQISRGNENLEPGNAHNFDLMYEHYSSKLDYLSFGVFGKLMKNQIITEQVDTEDDLPVFSPTNGADASVFGLEASANQSLTSIGIPLSVSANYTFTGTIANYGNDYDELPLANSPRHMGNLSFIYNNNKNGLFAVVGGTYRHFMFSKFEDTNEAVDGNEEIWLDRTFHVDVSLGYKVNDNLSLKLQMNNITNQAHTEVTGKPTEKYSQWSETESYGMSGLFVIEFKL